MGWNNTPNAERVHIGIFGKRNAGKSSLLNALTGQDLAVVSDVPGTTTDPVSKAMEILPLGPVLFLDTPGLDDAGPLGEKRVQKSRQVLNRTDLALLVVDARTGMTQEDQEILERMQRKEIPCIAVWNKTDLLPKGEEIALPALPCPVIAVSAKTGYHIRELRELLPQVVRVPDEKFQIVADLLNPSDFAVLVVPIDKAAPKGRLILPQQQAIRDILEADATAVVCKEYELRSTLEQLGEKPKIVITDSQVFAKVSADTPKDVLLTSFSILMARHKGILRPSVQGVTALDTLRDGDRVLIAEGCTHHRQCDDIGTVKLPRWIRNYTGVTPEFDFVSGIEFPDDLSPYRLIVHCGGCTLNEREMRYRYACAADAGVPITNYGILIAYLQGILARSVAAFPAVSMLLEKPGKEKP